MTKQEFEDRVKVNVNDELFMQWNRVYRAAGLNFDMDIFCRAVRASNGNADIMKVMSALRDRVAHFQSEAAFLTFQSKKSKRDGFIDFLLKIEPIIHIASLLLASVAMGAAICALLKKGEKGNNNGDDRQSDACYLETHAPGKTFLASLEPGAESLGLGEGEVYIFAEVPYHGAVAVDEDFDVKPAGVAIAGGDVTERNDHNVAVPVFLMGKDKVDERADLTAEGE